ncbi:hypothetical protein [Bacillus sp. Marseille-Q1617]|uniref:hypothetical protein n=1 Tax=Bacillus sp. Marseille-Q1617 TaxID=2736887 RepID=UPI00158D4C74|nr:hypothetical protein [Bacillus sp. Marseille-Q1617]
MIVRERSGFKMQVEAEVMDLPFMCPAQENSTKGSIIGNVAQLIGKRLNYLKSSAINKREAQ